MEIRPEQPDDYEPIGRVVGAAFGGDVEVPLVEAIRSSENYVPEFALVAVVGAGRGGAGGAAS